LSRSFSNQSGYSRFVRRDVRIERRWRDAEAVRDLSHSDIGMASIALAASMSSSVSFGGRPRSRQAPGSGRNWDYRYCWLRDAYSVVEALNRLGTTETMEAYQLHHYRGGGFGSAAAPGSCDRSGRGS
jgi:hypothetical protein